MFLRQTAKIFPKFFYRCLGSSSQIPIESYLLSALRSCSNAVDILKCKQIHAQAIVGGTLNEEQLQTGILGFYIRHGSFAEARKLFTVSDKRFPKSWQLIIQGSAMAGLFELSLLIYFKMFSYHVLPDRRTFIAVIRACIGLGAPDLGNLIHGTIRLMGFQEDPFLGSSLIKLYAVNGRIHAARQVFDKIPERDCVLWNVMLDAYAKNRSSKEAFFLFKEMRSLESSPPPNHVTLACVLSVCASDGKLGHGEEIHSLGIKIGLIQVSSVANTLLSMYAKCQCWCKTRKLFDEMPREGRELVTWNGIISGYAQNGLEEEAIELLRRMQLADIKPDSITLASVLPLFSSKSSLKQGEEVHAFMIRNGVELDAFLKSAFIDLYFKCRKVGSAERVFRSTGAVDVVIYSAMISGYVLNGLSSTAITIFGELLLAKMEPNSITIASLLPACSNLGTLNMGKELHGHVLKNRMQDLCFVGSALMDMYAKCSRLDLAHNLFENMTQKDSIAWNSMISSMVQNGQPEMAIQLFRKMGIEGFAYDCTSVSSGLAACANVSALHHGREIHGQMLRRGGSVSDVFAESALVDMYAKSGDLNAARQMFDRMGTKNEVSWNSIIAAYGSHGHLREACLLFERMVEAGYQPDHVTFLSLLSACGHAGRVSEGFEIFQRMNGEFSISPRMEHYACMVDLFGRAGKLHDALDLIKAMPFPADSGVWGALLGASRVHGAAEIAELASHHLLKLDPCNSGYYILMANVHAVAGRWEGARRLRKLMKERNVQKPPGCSWIEMVGVVHVFTAADVGHAASPMIYSLLKVLFLHLAEEGYVPSLET
ncbi:pentatricopeptide repeat-containing protein At4g21300-like [Wolffia australiana]